VYIETDDCEGQVENIMKGSRGLFQVPLLPSGGAKENDPLHDERPLVWILEESPLSSPALH
jgi:hypothetical protein